MEDAMQTIIDAVGTDLLTTISVQPNHAATARPGAAGMAAHERP